MHMTDIHKTKFCIADPNYERNKKVEIIDVIYDREYQYVLKELIAPSTKFCTNHVYDKIRAVVK